MTPVERILAHSIEGPTVSSELGSCLDCNLSADRNGYPRLKVRGWSVIASRAVLAHSLGRSLKPGMQANHHCDRSCCVRLEHLYEGTQKQNVADAYARGRAAVNSFPGISNGRARLNLEAVKVIRFLAARGISNTRMALAYGVDRSAVWQIVNNRTWVNA